MLLNKGLPTAIEDEPVIENTKKITANCQGFSMFQRVINFFMCLYLLFFSGHMLFVINHFLG